MAKVASITLTLNEEPRIKQCLQHIRDHVDWILVVDGESTDRTVEIAEQYADKVVVRKFSGSFAEGKNYARTLIPEGYEWVLWVDGDERFDPGFLRNMKELLSTAEEMGSACFRFPRCNLPHGKDYPDYQIRLFPNSQDIQWRKEVHEVPVYVPEDKPLSRMDEGGREAIIPVLTVDGYPIIHLPRREDLEREWWS